MRDLLGLEVISPCESEWAANIISLKNKGNKYHIVADIRLPDRLPMKDTYPMRDIQDMLDSLHGNQ